MEPEQSHLSQDTPTKPFTFDLTPDESAFIQSFLPKTYSFQELRKTSKPNKKDAHTKLLEQGNSPTQLLPRSSRVLDSSNMELEEAQVKTKRIRSKKVEDYPEDELPKRKMKQPSIRTTNSFGEDRLAQEESTQCLAILSQLKKNPNGKPFLEAVDPIQLKIPDYFEIVKTPMDLSTIERKLRSRVYSSFKQFKEDLTLIWMNSYKYNQKGSDIYFMTTEMDKLATKLIASRGSQPIANPYALPSPTYVKKPSITKDSTPKHPKKPKAPTVPKVHQDKQNPMTIIEKRKLCEDIKSLPKQHLAGVWKIVSENNDRPDLTFDIEKLPVAQLWQLEAYVNEKKNPSFPIEQPTVTNEPKSSESSFEMESDSGK